MEEAMDSGSNRATIHVTGQWFELCSADVADIVFSHSSRSSDAKAAKREAEDCAQYIKKTVLQCGKLEPEDTCISISLSPVWPSSADTGYDPGSYTTHTGHCSVQLNGADVPSIIEACSILKGKLGRSLRIEHVDVYASAASLSQSSYQALLRAVGAAHTSASDTTKCVGGSACRLISMKEVTSREPVLTVPEVAQGDVDAASPVRKPEHQQEFTDWCGLIRKGSLKITVTVHCEYVMSFNNSPTSAK